MSLNRIFSIFRIHREERWPAFMVLAYVVALNAIMVCSYGESFFLPNKDYHRLFTHHFMVSGFDPLTYVVLSDWLPRYNIYRHPLLAFFMWPFAQANSLCLQVFGLNLATIITAVLLVVSAFYGYLFLRRIFREVIELSSTDSTLLAWLCYAFAYVMLTVSVPDHFCFSMTMLLLTLYVAGVKMKRHRPFTIWQTILFFIITAGISLNNGIKIFLTNLFINGRRFWHWKNLLLAVIVPSALMWGAARWEWHVFEEPRYHARQVAKAKRNDALKAQIIAQVRDTITVKDSAKIAAEVKRIIRKRAHDKYVADHKRAWNQHTGKPMGKGEFSQWTDATTPRMASLVENWFGESIQLHQDHLLSDTLRARPVIVPYRWAICYTVEALLVLLFVAGIWQGRRSRFLWLALSFMAFDLFIHVVLGFGLNEVYIMGAHWLFVMPIAIGYLFRSAQGRTLIALRLLTLLLTLWLLAYNGTLYIGHLIEQIVPAA